MTVSIQCKRGSCVTQILLDSLHIVTGAERSNCVRVAKVMKSGFGHTQFGHHQLECPASCLGSDPVSGLVREYQTGLFVEILIV